jgi:hypothetical protein
MAVYDAHLHCVENACEPARALVVDFTAATASLRGGDGRHI